MNAMQKLLAALARGSRIYQVTGLHGEQIVLESPVHSRLEPGILLNSRELEDVNGFVGAATTLIESIAEEKR